MKNRNRSGSCFIQNNDDKDQVRWYMPAIQVIWEAEVEESQSEASLGKGSMRTCQKTN
jgi:hypothetical protein